MTYQAQPSVRKHQFLRAATFTGILLLPAQPPLVKAQTDAATPSSNAAIQAVEGAWRSVHHDGINALYLLLKLNGSTVSYSELEQACRSRQSRLNLVDLRTIASRFGLKAVIRRSNPEDLARMQRPVLTLFEDSVKGGRFVLLVGLGKDGCTYIDGATVRIQKITRDDFRRYWASVVLETTEDSSQWHIALGVGIPILALYWWVRCWPTRVGLKERGHQVSPMSYACFVWAFLFPSLFLPAKGLGSESPTAVWSAPHLRARLAEGQQSIKSFFVSYRSLNDKPKPDQPPGAYLYRVVAATADGNVYHVGAHGHEALAWDDDPFQQRCLIFGERCCFVNPVNRTYAEIRLAPTQPLPGSLPQEFFFGATGIWPFKKRPAPELLGRGKPFMLRDIAASADYSVVQPRQELFDGRWCHVLERPKVDRLWLDAERGCALMARECKDTKGVVMQRFELGGHTEVAKGVWIPRWIRNIHYDNEAANPEARTRVVKDAELTTVEARVNDVPGDLFVYRPPPGTLRLAEAGPPAQVQPGGLDHLDALARWVQTYAPGEQPQRSWFPSLFVGVSALVIISLREAWLRRLRRWTGAQLCHTSQESRP